MDFKEFRDSLTGDSPPRDAPALVAALWWDAKGNWAKAHEIAQEIESPDAAWVHAYLHCKEGDHTNAGYWYRRAGRSRSVAKLDNEWEEIARHLLSE